MDGNQVNAEWTELTKRRNNRWTNLYMKNASKLLSKKVANQPTIKTTKYISDSNRLQSAIYLKPYLGIFIDIYI